MLNALKFLISHSVVVPGTDSYDRICHPAKSKFISNKKHVSAKLKNVAAYSSQSWYNSDFAALRSLYSWLEMRWRRSHFHLFFFSYLGCVNLSQQPNLNKCLTWALKSHFTKVLMVGGMDGVQDPTPSQMQWTTYLAHHHTLLLPTGLFGSFCDDLDSSYPMLTSSYGLSYLNLLHRCSVYSNSDFLIWFSFLLGLFITCIVELKNEYISQLPIALSISW